ncbi:thioredoxin family protein [Virgibacillus sp. 179-BFC.A HS]|uniref:Thioredoxin family protein n=1 Tax=Tigheibacillus jepli TaxID=3035914 RepID=A0ABU5CGC3_9BACI|nr:thioredoxin family protein [Virgibacillus sp. 179-BFC.A HS]MDY0405260.1 thioredoxin family protein [Virgibacillus sp. 179-BFC.A HS]
MDLNAWFDKGMSSETYIEAMTKNKDNLLHIYDKFVLPENVDYDNIANRQLRAIVLTEDWCGDAMLNVPILLKIAEKTGIEVSFLLRDSNLELMDQYLTNGKSRSIPIFIFIDPAGNEVAKWGPRAPEVQSFVDDARSKLPKQDDPAFEEKQKEMIADFTKTYRQDQTIWNAVFHSIMETIAK